MSWVNSSSWCCYSWFVPQDVAVRSAISDVKCVRLAAMRASFDSINVRHDIEYRRLRNRGARQMTSVWSITLWPGIENEV